MDIAIDFDGTCVTYKKPQDGIGKDIGAVPVLRELVKKGHNLILHTMRSDCADGNYLTDAVNWFSENEIPLYGIQVHPTQKEWTSSPKCDADLYIDDKALGIPLRFDSALSERWFVDWHLVRGLLKLRGVL